MNNVFSGITRTNSGNMTGYRCALLVHVFKICKLMTGLIKPNLNLKC